MGGETEMNVSGWTVDTLRIHQYALLNSAIALVNEKEEGNKRFMVERDRRYSEVNVEKEKALKIKETADLAALQLAREIQTYKDEKANELREQIGSERGLYATKNDLNAAVGKLEVQLHPVITYVAQQQGSKNGLTSNGNLILGLVGVIFILLQIFNMYK